MISVNIVICGGTGFLGTALTQALIRDQHEVYILSRTANLNDSNTENLKYLHWDGKNLPELPPMDVLINLAGAPIQKGLWTKSRKQAILNSRVQTTAMLSQAIQTGLISPKIFLSGSALGYYGDTKSELTDENSPKGQGFLSEVTQNWEAAAWQSQAEQGENPRLVLLRTGVVLGDGGALSVMALPFKLGFGAILGSGHQYLPWIHLSDWVGMVQYCIENTSLKGPVNLCAPNALPMAEFSKALAKALRRPCWFVLPQWLLQLVLGEFSQVILYSQNVVPKRMLESGYKFQYPVLTQALAQIYAK